MKKTLLFAIAVLTVAGQAPAHLVGPRIIQYDDDELYDAETNPKGWDSNGTIPPQPEADFYVNMHNAGNVYYRLEPVEGSDPLYYQTDLSIVQGNFKIYAKEYWTERNKPGYDGNGYIYGSLAEPTSFHRDTYKQLGHPGGDLQIEGGGTWYGCELRFYPTGHDGTGTPELYVTGGTHNEQSISLTAVGKADSPTSGYVDYFITTGGVVKPAEQTYTVTMTYTPSDGNARTVSTEVTGLSGSFTDIDNLPAGSTTPIHLTVSIKNAPVFDNPSNMEQITGYKDLDAETDTEIVTQGHVYLVGDIEGVDWEPSKAIEGTLMTEYNPSSRDASSTYVWTNVPLKNDMRFRFTNLIASDWAELEAEGEQYYPTGITSGTSYCANLFDNDDTNTGNWYPYQTGTTTNSAWAPSAAQQQGSDSQGLIYNIFFNSNTGKVGIGWSTMVGINDITDGAEADAPVNVYDMLGRCVMRNVTPSEAVKSLPTGMYVIGDRKVAVR